MGRPAPWGCTSGGALAPRARGGREQCVSERDPAAGNKVNTFGLGIKPGIAVNLNDKLSFVAHAGFLGWQSEKEDVDGAKAANTFGFNLDGSNLSFGVYYNF